MKDPGKELKEIRLNTSTDPSALHRMETSGDLTIEGMSILLIWRH